MQHLVPNIGPQEQRRRLMTGLMLLLISTGMLLTMYGAHAWWHLRIAIFVPVWVASASLLQAQLRTCVLLAERGERNMDDGTHKIEDAAELAQVRRQARRVNLAALSVAAVVTVLVLAIPAH
jgi:hypothetical protein